MPTSDQVIGFKFIPKPFYGYPGDGVSPASPKHYIDTTQVVRKPKQFVKYSRHLPTDGVNLGFVNTGNFNDSNVSIINRGSVVTANIGRKSRDILTNTFLYSGGDPTNIYIDYQSRNLLFTDVFLNDVYTEENALYYVHKIPAAEAPALVDGVVPDGAIKILDKDFQEVSSGSYKIDVVYTFDGSGNPTATVDYIAVYNNFQNIYNKNTGVAELYYVSYTTPAAGALDDQARITLLNNYKVFNEVSGYDYHVTIWGKVYYVTTGFLGSTSVCHFWFKQQTITCLASRDMGQQRLEVLPPASSDLSEHWFPRVTKNSVAYTNSIGGYDYKYWYVTPGSIWPGTTFATFSESYRYKLVGDELAKKVNDSTLIVDQGSIDVSTTYPMDILIYDKDDTTLLYALTSDTSKTGTYNGITWDSTKILGWDNNTSLIQVGVTLKDYYNIYVTYRYQSKSYEVTGIDLNPVYNANASDHRYIIYMVPLKRYRNSTTLSTSTETIQYLTLDKNDTIIACSQTTAGGNTDLSGLVGRKYQYFKGMCSVENNTGAVGYGYFILAELSLQNKVSDQKIQWIDTRVAGGGIKDEFVEQAKQINPYVNFCSGIGLDAGMPYPGKSAVVVKLPYSILTEFGGRFEKKEVEEIVYRHLAFGSYPIIRYYGIVPNLYIDEDSLSTAESVILKWDSEPDYTFTVYKDGVLLVADLANSLSGNTYTATGLDEDRIYEFAVSATDADDNEYPKSIILKIKPILS